MSEKTKETDKHIAAPADKEKPNPAPKGETVEFHIFAARVEGDQVIAYETGACREIRASKAECTVLPAAKGERHGRLRVTRGKFSILA